MYCPECGAAYREGFTECSDCHIALVEELPASEEPNPNLELVRVLGGNSLIAVQLAKTLLAEAGIPFYMEGDDPGDVLSLTDAHIYRWWGIQVARDHEAEARKILDDAVAKEDLALDVDEEQALVEDQMVPGAE